MDNTTHHTDNIIVKFMVMLYMHMNNSGCKAYSNSQAIDRLVLNKDTCLYYTEVLQNLFIKSSDYAKHRQKRFNAH